MATISRSRFVSSLGARHGEDAGAGAGGVLVNDLAPETGAALESAGLGRGDLAAAAGSDGRIQGRAEWDALFGSIDRAEGDGRRGALTTSGDEGTPTPAGALLAALRDEVDRNRRAAHAGGVV